MSSLLPRLSASTALLLAAFALTTAADAQPAGPLKRRATLGVALGNDPAGAKVTAIANVQAAAPFGLKPGDVVVDLNGRPTPDAAALADQLARSEGGMNATLTVVRDGVRKTMSGRLVARPIEMFANGVTRMGAVPFQGGLLRDIFVTPPGGPKGPVLFLIQGYTCASVETSGPDSSHARLIDGLLARGISTYRIEKPQVGDSRGGPDCRDIGFKTETAAFEAGYRALRETYGISSDRIFILGHSLGGLEAPLLASRGPAPRGVAVYGTVLRNWFDYMIDVIKVQPFMAQGLDPVERESMAEQLRPVLERVMLRGEAPSAVAASNPDVAKLMREDLEWDGSDRLFGRHFSYWHEISTTPLTAAWKGTSSQVLSALGESDFAAVDDEDHRLIADIANFYRPGTARFVLVPRTGHGMRVDGTREEIRARALTGQTAAPTPFNAELIPLFADWIASAMAKPSMSTGS
jgi:hypothetical protein